MNQSNSNIITSFIDEWRLLSRSQKWLYFLYAVVLIGDFTDIFVSIENRLGLSFLIPFSDTILTIIALLGCIKIFFESLKIVDLIFLISIILFYIISQNTHPATAALHEEYFEVFVAAIPMYLVGLTFGKKTSSKVFVFFAIGCVILRFLFLNIQGIGVTETGDKNTELMTAAYGILPFVCLLFYNAIEKHGLLNYAIAFFGLFVLMSLGVRGPVACFITFIAIYLIAFKTHNKHNVLIKSLTAIVAVAFYSFSSYIILAFDTVASVLGFSTRVFESFQAGEFANFEESSGRDRIFENIMNHVQQHNLLWGEGLYSDRIITEGGFYAHNLELELLCEFGYIGGTIILLVISVLTLRAFRIVWDTQYAIILLAFFCSSIMQLQFSGSYIFTPVFWLFIGMCVSANRIEGRKRKLHFFR